VDSVLTTAEKLAVLAAEARTKGLESVTRSIEMLALHATVHGILPPTLSVLAEHEKRCLDEADIWRRAGEIVSGQ
jgi:hypothetical protein